MKRLSIRIRFTLWFAIMLLIMTNAGFHMAFMALRDIIVNQMESSITHDGVIIADSINMRDGMLVVELNDTNIQLMTPGVYYALYSPDGEWIGGEHEAWVGEYPKTTGEPWKIERPNDEHWLLYDKDIAYGGENVGYIRLFYGAERYNSTIDEMEHIYMRFFLPPSLLVSLLGGLLIARSALKPVKKITAVAAEIGAGDLSKRIDWTGKDEIGRLADTFNDMADNLQEAFNREKQFTSDVSHEIRTPITAIIMNAENAEISDDLEIYRASIKNILAKGRQLKSISTQLLMLAREKEHRSQVEIEPIDLNMVLTNIAEEVEEAAKARNIIITTSIMPDLKVNADLTLFARLMINLINNAVNYGKDGGNINITAKRKFDTVEIQVCDDGIGISTADLPHIFERFYRADKARSGGSAGLGLSFAKMIVDMHNGKIWANSKLGEGTCVFVELPAISG